MSIPATPADEQERLAALHALGILDTPSHEAYDGITRYACREFGVSISMITLLDAERQWFKSAVGISVRETIRAMAFCSHILHEEKAVVVPDTTQDARFSSHPLVLAAKHFRFYAGHRIQDPSGYPIGAFELAHHEPSDLDSSEQAKLTELTKIVEEQIALDYGSK